ncbi:type IV pilus biogenesis protein PilM [Photobacterium sp. 1_MG-2023]|uniref:type IV pilus biogenesis protein PilM n=1 Tax=Photobacterium sp. 1_MG-2023 TaxID=3062646 RepID=UPI0026E3AA91|nr:pilus assembly protein PilM [Photobacterium sp. 1_MG-2023]MDO6706231.1 pilus assembly protein PilM [Photobacterium sp. 1_MG-2023]
MLHKPVWTGIDIDHHSVKAVVLKQNKTQLILSAYAEVPFFPENETGPSSAGRPVEDSVYGDALLSALRQLRTLLPKRTGRCVLSMSDQDVIQREITVESHWEEDLTGLLIQELARALALDPEVLSLDYYLLSGAEGEEQDMRYRVFAARKVRVETISGQAKAAGFHPTVMELQGRALLWLLKYLAESRAVPATKHPALVYLHERGWELVANHRHPEPFHRHVAEGATSETIFRNLPHHLAAAGEDGQTECSPLWFAGPGQIAETLSESVSPGGRSVSRLTPAQLFPFQSPATLVQLPEDGRWCRAAALAIRGALAC